LAATLGKDIYLNEKKILEAFEMFDKEGAGYITVDQIMYVIGGDDASNYDKAVWEKILKEVDDNNDGKISFDEFKKMMTEEENS
jgi:Ca2+-binding EF-hand superfamily protein